MPVEDLMVVYTSPYIRPLARLIEDYETFGLVILDNHRARIYVVSSGRIEEKDKLARDIMKKHKKGGMSQARFQRLRVGAIEHFLKEVAEEMVKLFSNDNVIKIVIVGPGNAKILLKDYLPNELKNEILDVIDVDFDEADGYLISSHEVKVSRWMILLSGAKHVFEKMSESFLSNHKHETRKKRIHNCI